MPRTAEAERICGHQGRWALSRRLVSEAPPRLAFAPARLAFAAAQRLLTMARRCPMPLWCEGARERRIRTSQHMQSAMLPITAAPRQAASTA